MENNYIQDEIAGTPTAIPNPTVAGNTAPTVDPAMVTPEQQVVNTSNTEAIDERDKKFTSIENTFDYDGALKAGATNEQIIEHLKSNGASFKFDEAAEAGATSEQMLAHLYDQSSGIKAEKLKASDEAMLGNKLANNDFLLGAAKSLTGVSKTGNDLLNWSGFRDDKEYKARFDEVDKWTKAFDRNIKDKDFFSQGTLGEVFPSLVTLPVAVQSKMAIFALEGALGYAETRATNDVGTSAAVGAVSGLIGVGIVKVMDSIGEKGAKNVYDYYRQQLHFTPDEADEIFTNWSKTMETDGKYADRLKSIVDYAGDAGAQIKTDVAKLSPSVKQAIGEGRAERIRTVRSLIDTDIDVKDFSETLYKQVDVVKENYNKAKWEINNLNRVANDAPLNIPESLDEIATDRAAINELLGNESATVTDYIDAMPHLNEILRKVKGTHLNKWSVVKTKVDDAIRDNLSPQDYAKWKEVNADYAHMATVKNSKLGEALTRALGKSGKKSQVSTSRVLELIKADKDSGDLTFESIKHLFGSKDTAKLENLIIKDAFGDHVDDIRWEALAKNLDKKGFVSDEGKQFQELIDNIAKSFKTDDDLKSLAQQMQSDNGGIGTNLLEKFQVSVAGKMFRMVMKYTPGEGAKAMRMADKLADVLKSPSKMREINRAVSELSPGVKERMVQEVLADMPKLLEYKPNAGMLNVDSKPIHVTPGGTAVKSASDEIFGANVSRAVQAEDLTRWIKDYKLSDVDGNKLVDAVHEYASDAKFERVLKATSKRLKADDMAYNAKVVANTIKAEARDLVKAINKAGGAKLSNADSESLVNMLFNRYIKGCK